MIRNIESAAIAAARIMRKIIGFFMPLKKLSFSLSVPSDLYFLLFLYDLFSKLHAFIFFY